MEFWVASPFSRSEPLTTKSLPRLQLQHGLGTRRFSIAKEGPLQRQLPDADQGPFVGSLWVHHQRRLAGRSGRSWQTS